MNRKYYRLLVLCPILLASGCAATGAITPGTNSDAIQVLFIGNSYVFANNLPQVLVRLAESGEHKVYAEMAAKGGWTLEQHAASEGTLGKIASREWDYVILQEQSVRPSIPAEREERMYPAARALDSAIADQGAGTVLMMTWGRRDGLREAGFTDYGAMQTQLATGYTTIGAELGALVAPVGLAWGEALRQRPNIGLWDTDGSHPAPAGSYLAACVFYAVLFEESPEGLSYHADLSPDEAQFLQTVAAQTTDQGR
jgi:hypothetical protein